MELATVFPSKFIKAADLQGHDVPVVIARAEVEKIGDDTKLVLYFQGMEKGLVTNRTNADRIAHLYGTNTDGWIGREIVLYTDMVNFQNRVVEAIRVRPPQKRGDNITTAPQRMASTPLPNNEPPPHDGSNIRF